MAEPAKGMPEGSSAFERAMAESHMEPIIEVSTSDETDCKPKRRSSIDQRHSEDKIVHGLNHCYKIEGGHVVPSFRCHHNHHRLSNGHLEEMMPAVGPPSPSPKRRMSLVPSGSSLLSPDDFFRNRSSSDAGSRRRVSMPVNNYSPNDTPPKRSPVPQRRGSNVVLHSDELHYVYDQYLSNKK